MFKVVSVIKIPIAKPRGVGEVERLYLVESGGSLLMVDASVSCRYPHEKTFEFYEVNVKDGRIDIRGWRA